jgi:hypothetical protein
MSSCKSLFKNSFAMFICQRNIPYDKAMDKIVLIVIGITIGLKVSENSQPLYLWNPLATKRALYM